MIYLAYAIYFLVLVASIALIRRGWKERDSFDLTGGIILVVGMFTVIMLTVKEQLKPEPVEIIESVNSFIEYDFGEVGITAFQDDDGTVFVVSCFQGEGDTITNCWDRRFEKE